MYKFKKFYLNCINSVIILIVIMCVPFSYNANAQTVIAMKKQGGVYVVPCKVNGLDLRFIFDTGASDVSISLTEALFMIKNGYLKKEDIGEKVYYSIANGDVSEGTKLNLKVVEFAGLKLYNIEASIVHQINAPLLLGQSAIQKLGKIQLDGNTLTILSGNGSYNYSDFVYTASGESNRYSDVNCKQVPIDEIYSGDKMFNIKQSCNLWEKREVFDGKLLCEIPVNAKVKLMKRVFDWWQLEYNGKLGWTLETNIDLPICMLWLRNIGGSK